MINCPTCGASNVTGAVFCSQCATNITGTTGGVRYNPHAHAPPQPYGYGNSYVLPPRSGTILALGILSIVVCGVMGPIAWSMGNEELRRISAGETEPSQRGTVSAGRICGIIGSCLLVLSLVYVAFIIVMIAGVSRHGSY